jgi:hypothetical protein
MQVCNVDPAWIRQGHTNTTNCSSTTPMVPRFTIVDGAPAKQCCNGGVSCTVTRSYTHRARQKKSTHTHVYMHPTTAELHSSTRNSVVVASTVHHTVNNKCTAGRSPGPGRHKLVMELVSGNSARRHYCIARPSLPLPPVLLHHARITDATTHPAPAGRDAARPGPTPIDRVGARRKCRHEK